MHVSDLNTIDVSDAARCVRHRAGRSSDVEEPAVRRNIDSLGGHDGRVGVVREAERGLRSNQEL